MAQFRTIALDKARAREDLEDFKGLLNDPERTELSERGDILPFFAARENLAALLGTYNPNITSYRNLSVCFEFDIFGDHVADLAIGDPQGHQYCFVEFEDAKETSIFKKSRKATPEWSARFEHGFSQLIDWILWIENNKGTAGFLNRFDAPSIQYVMLLVVGRDKYISSGGLRERLAWRTDQVVVASKKVHCLTFDKLCVDLFTRLDFFGY